MRQHKEFLGKWKIDTINGADIGMIINSEFEITNPSGDDENYELAIGDHLLWNGAPPPSSASPNPVSLTKEDPPIDGTVYFTAGVVRSGTGKQVDLAIGVCPDDDESLPLTCIFIVGNIDDELDGKIVGTARGGHG